MRFLRRDDDFGPLERELRARRSEPSRQYVRELASRLEAKPRWFAARKRYVLVGALTALVVAASASAGVINLTLSSTTSAFDVVKKITLTSHKDKQTLGQAKASLGKFTPAQDMYATTCGAPPAPQCVVEVDPDDPSVIEGNSGSANCVTFTLTLKQNKTTLTAFTVNFSTVDGSASTADNDYVPKSGAVLFPVGSSSATAGPFCVKGDTTVEPDETYDVVWSPSNSAARMDDDDTASTITIKNDDGPVPSGLPKVKVKCDDEKVTEGNVGTKTVSCTVTLSKLSNFPIKVHYTTEDGTATAADSDYVPKSGDLIFPPGTKGPQTVTVTINGDTKKEPDENFFLNFAVIGGNATIDGSSQHEFTIENDD